MSSLEMRGCCGGFSRLSVCVCVRGGAQQLCIEQYEANPRIYFLHLLAFKKQNEGVGGGEGRCSGVCSVLDVHGHRCVPGWVSFPAASGRLRLRCDARPAAAGTEREACAVGFAGRTTTSLPHRHSALPEDFRVNKDW